MARRTVCNRRRARSAAPYLRYITREGFLQMFQPLRKRRFNDQRGEFRRASAISNARRAASSSAQKLVVKRKTLLWIGRDHSLQNARSRRRYLRRDGAQLCRVLLQFMQLCRGICAAVDWRFPCDSMKQRCAKAVNVAAKVLRLVPQSLGRDIRRRSPDHTSLSVFCDCCVAKAARPKSPIFAACSSTNKMLAGFTSR